MRSPYEIRSTVVPGSGKVKEYKDVDWDRLGSTASYHESITAVQWDVPHAGSKINSPMVARFDHLAGKNTKYSKFFSTQ